MRSPTRRPPRGALTLVPSSPRRVYRTPRTRRDTDHRPNRRPRWPRASALAQHPWGRGWWPHGALAIIADASTRRVGHALRRYDAFGAPASALGHLYRHRASEYAPWETQMRSRSQYLEAPRHLRAPHSHRASSGLSGLHTWPHAPQLSGPSSTHSSAQSSEPILTHISKGWHCTTPMTSSTPTRTHAAGPHRKGAPERVEFVRGTLP